MSLAEDLTLVASARPGHIPPLHARLDGEGWIGRGFVATETATIRKRRLPTEPRVWIVVGMALLRVRKIE